MTPPISEARLRDIEKLVERLERHVRPPICRVAAAKLTFLLSELRAANTAVERIADLARTAAPTVTGPAFTVLDRIVALAEARTALEETK